MVYNDLEICPEKNKNPASLEKEGIMQRQSRFVFNLHFQILVPISTSKSSKFLDMDMGMGEQSEQQSQQDPRDSKGVGSLWENISPS